MDIYFSSWLEGGENILKFHCFNRFLAINIIFLKEIIKYSWKLVHYDVWWKLSMSVIFINAHIGNLAFYKASIICLKCNNLGDYAQHLFNIRSETMLKDEKVKIQFLRNLSEFWPPLPLHQNCQNCGLLQDSFYILSVNLSKSSFSYS